MPLLSSSPEAFKGDAEQEAFSQALDARKELIQVPEKSQMYFTYGIQAVAANLEFPSSMCQHCC